MVPVTGTSIAIAIGAEMTASGRPLAKGWEKPAVECNLTQRPCTFDVLRKQ